MSKKERIENLEDHVIRLTEELDETKYAVKLLGIGLEIVNDILSEVTRIKKLELELEEEEKKRIEQAFDWKN